MPSSPLPRIGLLALGLIVVILLQAPALFLRSAPYTPDEPREYDIAWNMVTQDQKSVPLLAGEPFCEKPPLTYWAAAASMSVFGHSLLAARAPNLVWTAITIACLLLWMRGIVQVENRTRAAVFTALIAGCSVLLFRVQIWLATDAPLVAATALSLLGAWRGFTATSQRARLIGYSLFHLGLTAAFFAKNFLGWLVPLFALAGIIVWERRWRELLRFELYVGLVLQLALIVPWVASIAARDDGSKLLRVFFIDNTLGRLLPIATEDEYQLGHRNHFGKYLVELPYYVLPWTFALVAAVRWSLRQLRATSAYRLAARFALLCFVPGLVFLSFSQTARDVYFAPELLGVAMLLGVWCCGFDERDRFDRVCLKLTSGLAIFVGIALMIVSAGVPLLQDMSFAVWPMLFGLIAVAAISLLAVRWQVEWPQLKSLALGFSIFALGITSVNVLLFPAMNPSQDLSPTARAVSQEFGSRQIAILRDDETMRAYLDFAGGVAAITVRSLDDAAAWLSSDPNRILLIELYTDHITPNARKRLGSWHDSWANLRPPEQNPSAVELQRRGFGLLWQYTVIGGRTYGVLNRTTH